MAGKFPLRINTLTMALLYCSLVFGGSSATSALRPPGAVFTLSNTREVFFDGDGARKPSTVGHDWDLGIRLFGKLNQFMDIILSHIILW